MPKRTERRFTGWHMLLIMVAFFGTIITVNLTMAFLASGSWTGLMVKNSYVASQDFNAKLAAAKAQKALGWTSQLNYADGEITFALHDDKGRELLVDDVFLTIGRPAFEAQDETLVLEPRHGGGRSVRKTLAPGIWAATVETRFDGEPYRRDARIYVSPGGIGRVE